MSHNSARERALKAAVDKDGNQLPTPGVPASFVAPKDKQAVPAVHDPAPGKPAVSPSNRAFAKGTRFDPWYCSDSGDCNPLYANQGMVRVYEIEQGHEVAEILAIVEKKRNRQDQVIVRGDNGRIYVWEADNFALSLEGKRPIQVNDRFEFGAFSGRVAGISDAWDEDLILRTVREALASDTTEDVAVAAMGLGGAMGAPILLDPQTPSGALRRPPDPRIIIAGTIIAAAGGVLYLSHAIAERITFHSWPDDDWDDEIEDNATHELLDISTGAAMGLQDIYGGDEVGWGVEPSKGLTPPDEFTKAKSLRGISRQMARKRGEWFY